MKKITTLLALLVLLGCAKDELEFEAPFAEVPEALQILDPIGLKLESAIVTNKVAINAKFDVDGTYKIKIINIAGRVVSQDKITAVAGDNLLNIYTTALETSSYQVHITDEYNNVLGIESFSMIN
jgi:hypothetical protein